MTIRNFLKLRPGQPVPAGEVNRALKTVERGTNFTGRATCDGVTGNHQAVEDLPRELWARITGSGTITGQPTSYSWIQEWDSANGTLNDGSDLLSGTTSILPAYELNAIANVQVGAKVRLYLGFTGDQYWFSAGWTGTFTATMVSDVSCSGSTLTVTKKTLTIVVTAGLIAAAPTFQ